VLIEMKSISKMFIAGCLLAMAACKPAESTAALKTSETALVAEKIEKFKADPSRINMVEAEKALADLNSQIKELEVREATAGGAEKDEITKKIADLQQKYNAYMVDFTAARVKSSLSKASETTEEALQKAGEAVKGAADAVSDSFKSDKPRQ
jgi:hypothetical protein